MFHWVLLWAFLFLGGGVDILYGETVVLHVFDTASPDRTVEDILYLAAGVALVDAGYSSTREEEADAEYSLYTQYSVRGEFVTVEYELVHSASRSQLLAVATRDVPINLDLEVEIASVINELLEVSGMEPLHGPNARIYGVGRDAVPGDTGASEFEGTTTDPPVADASDDVDSTVGGNSEDAPSQSNADDVAPGAIISRKAFYDTGSRWAVTIASGVGLIVGDASTLFRHSVFGRASLGYTHVTSGVSLESGLTASVYRVYTNQDVTGGPLHISTVGPKASVYSVPSSPARIGLTGASGVALLSVRNKETYMTKSVPFLELLMQATYMMTEEIALGFSLGWLSVFEGSTYIHALTTSLSLTLGTR